MINRIYLDMDGVLVNWHAGFARHGLGRPGMVPPLTYTYTEHFTLEELKQAIQKAHATPGFWEDLKPLKFGDTLKAKLAHYGFPPDSNKVYLLTAYTPGSYKGKRAWVERYYPEMKGRLIMETDKHLYARPDALLIDDHRSNVQKFRQAGGHAIETPSPYAHYQKGLESFLEELHTVLSPG